MAIRVYKPTSPARRFMSVLTFEEVTKTTPEKSLLESKKKNAGRNKQGKITVRHQGGGNKVKYRVIDFKRNKDGIPAKVAGIEYDPNRTAFIALLNYADGEKRYILAPIDLKTGDTVISGEGADIKPGNALPIRNIPLGTLIHNIEIVPGRGGQLRAQRLQAVAAHLLRGKTVQKGGQHPRGDVHGVERQHVFYVQRGKLLRRVQAAVRRDAFQYGFPRGRARPAARALIELHRNTRFLPFTCRQNYDIVFPSKIQVFFLSRHVKLS